jgi:CheY-like chemotaxis protein
MSGHNVASILVGKQVLIAEDEVHVLLLLEDMLTSLGCRIAQTASRVDEVLRLAQSCEVDVAVLDVNLYGQKVYPAAEVLRRRSVPFVFSTGYSLGGIDPEWATYPVVQKPFLVERLAQALAQALPGSGHA